MKQKKNDAWPTSDIETIDRKISERLQRVATGNATSQEISEASGLIRERADFMMPGIFRTTTALKGVKKAS
ncbi:hypothetical protein [Methylocystis sp. S23]|jgi:hypothetical protein